MSKAYFKNTLRSIKRSFSRFISIIAVVVLGVGVFVGYWSTCPNMLNTSERYYNENNLFDIRLQSYIGLYEGDLAQLQKIRGVKNVVGQKFTDGFAHVADKEGNYQGLLDLYGSKMTVRVYGLDPTMAAEFTSNSRNNGNYINRLTLLEGKYPTEPGECVVTNNHLATPQSFQIGQKIKIEGDNESVLHSLKVDEFTIVGVVMTPYFLSFERGESTAGSGKLGDYIYVSNDNFTENINYYSEAYITLNHSHMYEPYSDEYNEYVDSVVKIIREKSGDIISQRKIILKTDLQPKIDDGKAQLKQAQLDFDTQITEARLQLDELRDLVQNGQQVIDEANAQLEAEYAKALEQINAGSTQHEEAVKQYEAAFAEFESGKVQWDAANIEYEKNLIKYDEGSEELKKAKNAITLGQTEVIATKALIASLETTHKNLVEKGSNESDIREIEMQIDLRKTELAVAEIRLAEGKALYAENENKLAQAKEQLDFAKIELDTKKKELEEAEVLLAENNQKIQDGGLEIQMGSMEARTEYSSAKSELTLKQAQLTQAKEKLPIVEKEFAEKEAESQEKLDIASTAVQKGESVLESLEGASWFVDTRRDMPGYSSYGSAAYSMRTIALVFSTFFFIVATLVCLTTMTRMVQEERGQLGCLKSLGYTNGQILSKYLIYASIACIIGSVIGIWLGVFVLPKIFVIGWVIVYQMPPLEVFVYPGLIALGFCIMVFLTLAAVVIACYRELRHTPTVLMRPKPPKTGKHIFLERIGFIWYRLSFKSKATTRNLLRSKKRLIMSVLGIAGCAALLVTGVGFVGSARAVITNQFGEEGIARFDLQVAFKDEQASSEESEVAAKIRGMNYIEDTMLSHIGVFRGSSNSWDDDLEVNVYVPELPDKFGSFVRLIDDKTGEILKLDDTGAIITDSFARSARAKVGDMITVSRTEGAKEVTYEVKVAGIVDNHTFHYVYMTENYYKQVFGVEPGFNSLVGLLDDSAFADGEYLELETKINDFPEVNGSIFTNAILVNFSHIINSLYIIISVVVIAAAILSFVVMYILNNTNIKERIRELATLKALGLSDRDVSSYVYRENIIFTLIAIPVGFVMGIVLHKIIIDTIVIEAVTLGQSITFLSYVLSAVLMLLFALIVNIIMHRYLKKLSIVESLKSVE